ncbi:MAG: EAL domain-containing protein [Rhodocyclaceae bacterium]|nr:EAL domain-containing protein [Rhodocyclaceae bacterium]
MGAFATGGTCVGTTDLELAHIVFNNAAEGICITDTDARVLAVNEAFSRLTGYASQEVKGRKLSMLQSGRHGPDFYEHMWASLRETGRWQGEIWNRRKNGEVYPEWLSVSAVRDAAGEIQHYVGVFTDIGQIMAEQAQLRDLAYFDPVTRLPNRTLFRDRFEQVARRALREMKQLGMLMIEVAAHTEPDARDEFTRALAASLQAELRETDTLARVGEHEFLVLIEGIDGPRSASVTANHLLKALEQPVRVSGAEVYPSVCIGISLYPMDGHNMDSLMTAADSAMLQARSRGRHAYSFYSAEMTAYANERMILERRLRVAIANKALAIVFQPLFESGGQRLVAAEALVRWQDPELGVVSPDRFVPLAEDVGLIHALGEWVMREAFATYVAWREQGVAPPVLSINISARQLERADFVESVAAILHETGMAASQVEFEFRESVLLDVAYVVSALEALSDLGIRLSIDGFGTGFSPLSNLQSLPVAKLNIDRSFVGLIGHDHDNDTLIRAIVRVAQTLGLTVVAEGVETEAQAAFLRDEGCNEFQGYLLGRAVPGEEFIRYFGRK